MFLITIRSLLSASWRRYAFAQLAAMLVSAPITSRAQSISPAESAVRQVLSDQQAAWNRGDVDAFMDGYWKSDSLRFASGGSVQQGWEATLKRYRSTYPDRSAMGSLTFTIYSVDLLSADHAFVFGRYELAREEDHPTGLFTLLFRRFGDDWRIIFDHTSAGESPDEE